MYSRQNSNQTYTFEASGGLLNAGLVMLDRETGSHWSIIQENAIHGPAKGQQLRKAEGADKITWEDWKRRHPDTLVLSVEGREHDPRNHYDRYFASKEGFRKMSSGDDRLADKAAIYAIEHEGEHWAAPHKQLIGGGVFDLSGQRLFLYRAKKDHLHRATVAFWAPAGSHFEQQAKSWKLIDEAGAEIAFDSTERNFGELTPANLGFDTFWYIWSLTHNDTEVLEKAGRSD